MQLEYQNENFNGALDFRSNFHDGWKINANLHEYSEILYCRKGAGRVLINGNEILINEKQFVWIPPNYIHEYNCQEAQVICAVFSNDLIPLFFKALEGRYYCVRAIDANELSPVLESLYKLKKDDYLSVSGYLNLICAYVIKHAHFENTKQTDGFLYQKVISYISTHYTEDIKLAQIAVKFGYNEKYLSHALHNLTGIHFRQIINFYRINYSKMLLTSSKNMNIASIATKCGFNSLNTFNREFKRIAGISPREYRCRQPAG